MNFVESVAPFLCLFSLAREISSRFFSLKKIRVLSAAEKNDNAPLLLLLPAEEGEEEEEYHHHRVVVPLRGGISLLSRGF